MKDKKNQIMKEIRLNKRNQFNWLSDLLLFRCGKMQSGFLEFHCVCLCRVIRIFMTKSFFLTKQVVVPTPASHVANHHTCSMLIIYPTVSASKQTVLLCFFNKYYTSFNTLPVQFVVLLLAMVYFQFVQLPWPSILCT